MKIREVNENKKQYISLLLLADEQENMIDRYLERGTMYVLEDSNVTTYKTKNFILDGPCNKREMAFFMAPHMDSVKYLIYKEKRRIKASLS